jgi:hypothetical protein
VAQPSSIEMDIEVTLMEANDDEELYGEAVEIGSDGEYNSQYSDLATSTLWFELDAHKL